MTEGARRHAQRRPTVPVRVGTVVIGGAAPIAVQTMTKTQTEDAPATIAQIQRAAKAGADIIRVTCDTRDAAASLHEIVRESPIPVVADIHYDAPLALLALEAGVHCLRLNPGNITDSAKVADIAREAKARNVPIRIGVNAGSIPQRKELTRGRGGTIDEIAQNMVAAALSHIRVLEELDFRDIKVSLKASDVLTNVAANRAFVALGNRYPLHLGLTEAGPVDTGQHQERARHRAAPCRGHRRHDPRVARRLAGGGGAGRAPDPRQPAGEVATARTWSRARRAAGSRSTWSRWSRRSRKRSRA